MIRKSSSVQRTNLPKRESIVNGGGEMTEKEYNVKMDKGIETINKIVALCC